MRADQARTIPIDRYLEAQGFKPARARMGGRELWYSSPLRQGDKTPSFKIDTLKNLWYDHGLGQGGNIIDLIMHLCACDVRDALHHLERTGLYSIAGNSGYRPSQPRAESASLGTVGSAGEKEKQSGCSALELISKAPLEHPALLKYLIGRGINLDIAREYVSQIDFKAPQSGGTYFGVGYPAGGGFEVRNALFKGFVGSGKAPNLHKGKNQTKLMVFEGFIDFLSYLSMKNLDVPDGDALVLNSTAFKARALPYVINPQYEEIQLFLDNDEAGNAVTAFICDAECSGTISDMRQHYATHVDLNDWHTGRKL
mgnify:FL=1|jgi:hypothetical protein